AGNALPTESPVGVVLRCGAVRSRLQRRLVHQGDLLAQLEDPVLPITLRVEPREGGRERRIVNAPGEPRGVVQEAERSQRLDQRELAPVEIAKRLVSLQHDGEL